MFLVNYAYLGWEEHQNDNRHVTEAACPLGLVYKDKQAALYNVKLIVEGELAGMFSGGEWVNNWVLTGRDGQEETWTGYGSGGDAVAAIVIREVEFSD